MDRGHGKLLLATGAIALASVGAILMASSWATSSYGVATAVLLLGGLGGVGLSTFTAYSLFRHGTVRAAALGATLVCAPVLIISMIEIFAWLVFAAIL